MKKSEALKALGLAEGATDDDIKKAHRKLIIENHPDKFGQDPAARAQAEEKTKVINEARDVLLNRSWDPEYATAGTPYGAPFAYGPSAGSRGAAGGNPFAGMPFSETFVWTSWDDSGRRTTHTASGADPFSSMGADPFDAFRATGTGSRAQGYGFYGTGNPFADFFSAFIPREPTIEERIAEAEAELALDRRIISIKVVLLCVAFILHAPATGLYLYTIISIGQGIWKRLSFLSIVLLVPFVMLALIFSPGGDATIGIIAAILFAASLGFDVYNVHTHLKRIKELKKQR